MKNRLVYFIVSVCLIGMTKSTWAADLMDVYQQAFQNDQVYQEAKANMKADQEALPQSVATLLPNISATANTIGNYVNILSVSGVNPGTPIAATVLGTTKFNSNGYTVSLSQPIFDFGNWMQVKQASNLYKEAAATFSAATQDLIIRVARAYFDVLFAQDNLTYTKAQVAANAQELDQTKQRYNVGLDAITSVYNAQASYDAIVAQEFAAENTLRNNMEALRQLTGQYYSEIEGLKIPLPLIYPQPMDVERWVSASEQYNQTLLAARYDTEAARAAVKVNFGNHLPVLSAVGSYGRFNGTAVGTTDYDQGTIGLQVNVPIFQGGLVNSQVRQAEDKFAASSANTENTHRQVVVDTRQNFNNVLSGISQVKADRQAILSAESSLASTQESFKVGTRTIVDVLLAQQQLYQAKTTYAQDEYAYLLDTLLLKQAAGTLCPNDLAQINTWLHGPNKIEQTYNSSKRTFQYIKNNH